MKKFAFALSLLVCSGAAVAGVAVKAQLCCGTETLPEQISRRSIRLGDEELRSFRYYLSQSGVVVEGTCTDRCEEGATLTISFYEYAPVQPRAVLNRKKKLEGEPTSQVMLSVEWNKEVTVTGKTKSGNDITFTFTLVKN